MKIYSFELYAIMRLNDEIKLLSYEAYHLQQKIYDKMN